MRELLFRGKELRSGIWHYGNYGVFRNDFTGVVDGYWIESNHYEGGYCEIQIDPETLGQYIGRKDKNGAKVFKGDKVKWHHYHDNFSSVVTYCPIYGGYLLFCKPIDYDDIYIYEFEVVQPPI